MAIDDKIEARLRGATDDNVGEGGPREDVHERQMLTTSSWQVASIPANAKPKKSGSRIGLTENKRAQVALNVYPPHRRDEMHCHPGSEHIFIVLENELRVRGLKEGEDVVLNAGEFVHINQSYFYQLANETEKTTVICGVFTKPPKKPKLTRYTYRGEGGIDPATLEGE